MYRSGSNSIKRDWLAGGVGRLFYDYKNYLTWLQVRCAAEVITNLFLEGVWGGLSGGGGGAVTSWTLPLITLCWYSQELGWNGYRAPWIKYYTKHQQQNSQWCAYACINDFWGGCLCRTDDISKSVGSPGSLSAIIATSWKYAAISTSCHMCLFAWKLCRTMGNQRRVFYVMCLNWNTQLLPKL